MSKERFENEMADLGSSRDMSGRESEAAGRISGLERKIQYVTADKVYLFSTWERLLGSIRKTTALYIPEIPHAE